MSFCIRSISSTGRYGSSLSACKTSPSSRNFHNRRLLQQVDSGISSEFLNEFLGYKAFITRNKARLSFAENLTNRQHQSSIGIGCLVDAHKYNENSISHTSQIFANPETISKDFKFNGNTFENRSNDILQRSISLLPLSIQNQTKGSPMSYSNGTSNFSKIDLKHLGSIRPKANPEQKKSQREENLEHVFQTLSMDLPRFFTRMMDYSIYTADVEFINNIRNTSTKGIIPYMKQVMFAKYAGHWKFAYVKLDVIKITKHPKENTVKVRWQANGIKGYKAFLKFYKFRVWKLRETVRDNQEVWHDGFSIFYVNDDGKIFKHVADKMMPDDDHLVEEKSSILKPPKITPSLT